MGHTGIGFLVEFSTQPPLTTKISQDNHLRIHDSRFLAAESWTMRPLSLEESEDLLREKVFGGHDIPPRLREAAKKIAKRCRGLPLMILTVADLLNNTDAQYWDDVAEKRNSVLRDASKEIAKVLFPVYDCFPQHLKMFFLYVGAFSEDSELLSSKLKHLLDAEGFLEEHTLRIILRYDLNNFGFENNIVSIEPNKVTGFTLNSYTINPFWRLLFNNVASGDKFLHVVDSSFNSSEDGVIKGQRRLCLHSNFLFNFKAVHHSVKRDCASNARSLLCFGPYHQYSMPLDVGFKLLRVLDAVKVRFYMFPIEIVNLVQLQYLALSYSGKLPTSISKLFNLQFLIIHPHVSIKSFGAPSYVPVQIWDMQELKYVDILGSNLPNPDSNATLKKLSTLLGVSPNSCTRRGVLERIPKLRKLGIQIELTPQYDQAMSRVFLPDNLDTFKCSILNPEVKEGLVAPLTPLSVVPQTLRKLHLSGLGYPWKYMKMIGSLPKLEVPKLRCYAFRGPKWESKMKSFRRLKLLVIEDSDLVHWIPLGGSFPILEQLSLKHCYKLQNLHWPNDGGMIELVDCSPLAVACAEQLKRKTRKGHLDVIASFDDDELQRIYPN